PASRDWTGAPPAGAGALSHRPVETTATAASLGGSSRRAASPRRPTPGCRPSPDPTLPLVLTLVRSSMSVPTATSTVASLGDISNESLRGHYQRVTTHSNRPGGERTHCGFSGRRQRVNLE